LYIFTGVDGKRFAWIAELLELKGNEYVLDVGSGAWPLSPDPKADGDSSSTASIDCQ